MSNWMKAPSLAAAALAAGMVALPASADAGVRISPECYDSHRTGANRVVEFDVGRTGAVQYTNGRETRSWYFNSESKIHQLNRACEQAARQEDNYADRLQRQRSRPVQGSGNIRLRNGRDSVNIQVNPRGGGRINLNVGGQRIHLGF